jgi:hypothetical protein
VKKICVIGPVDQQLAYLSRTNRRLHTRPLEGPRLLPVLSYLVAAKREKLIPHTHGKAAGDENGLVASTTNITRACRSVEPLLETCIGMSAP